MTRLVDLLNFFFPDVCLICNLHKRKGPVCSLCLPPLSSVDISYRCRYCYSNNVLLNNNYLCTFCKKLPKSYPVKWCRYLWDYTGKAQKIISYLKYAPSIRTTKFVANILSDNFNKLYPPEFFVFDLIIPVPPSKKGLSVRGFCVTKILAEAISKKTGISHAPNGLKHIGYKNFQVELDNSERFKNIQGAFRGNQKVVKGKSILLLDDVVTTGATSLEAAKCLYQNGAISVALLSLARSPAWSDVRSNHHSTILTQT